jgi:hypothetical protein
MVASLAACSKPADTVVTKTETTTSPQGSVETKEQSKRVGDTLEVKTETKSKTDDGTVKTDTEAFVGTVTVYEPGKKIEVLTGESTRHAVDLAGKNVQVDVVGPVAVGAHVRLVEEKGDRGTRVSVTVENQR